MTTKSNEIIRTIKDLIEHYLPWLLSLILFALAFVIFYEGIKEINDLGFEKAEGALVMLFMFPILYWILGRWAWENDAKINKDEIDTDNKTT